jgi:hypothetical protein
MKRWRTATLVVALAGLAGCASLPTGPSLNALPGSRVGFEQFQVDDAACRQYAYQSVGGTTPSTAANQSVAASAAVGTALGAATGALVTGTGSGAAWGAGFGLLTGAAVGSSYAGGSYYATQQRYDGAYYQCMYAKGNKVPVYGGYARAPSYAPAAPQPAAAQPAPYPPPPNAPPPIPR